MNSDATVTFVSCPPEHADALARKLVEAGVAACVNVIPGVHSVYRWVRQAPLASEARGGAERPATDGRAGGSNSNENLAIDGKGEVFVDLEALLVIKTSAGRIEDLKATVLKHHPYELPEFITVNVAQGHGPYLQWILDSTK